MSKVFSFPIRVYIEDTDAGGIVYHANHIRYLERVRTEWLRASGIGHYWKQNNYSFVVHHIDINYHKPIIMDDLLNVTVQLVSCKAASMSLQQNIYRDEMLLASATVTLACLDKQFRPCRIPDELRQLIISGSE